MTDDRRLCPCGSRMTAYCSRRIGKALVRYRRCSDCGRTDKIALDLSFLHQQKIGKVSTGLSRKTG